MKKLFALIAIFGMLTIGASQLMAQEEDAATVETEETVETAVETEAATIDDEVIESTSMHAAIKQKFIEIGRASCRERV